MTDITEKLRIQSLLRDGVIYIRILRNDEFGGLTDREDIRAYTRFKLAKSMHTVGLSGLMTPEEYMNYLEVEYDKLG